MSPLTRLYLAFSYVSDPLWKLAHRKRLRQGKEVAARLDEKYGRSPVPRPEGTLFWFHALSVGESLALLPLIERALADLPKAHVLLTTSTATSADALAKAGLPERALHVLQPIDTVAAVRRFLSHWRPDVAVFAELDFWPRLMFETHRREVPMVLVNARMTRKTLHSRKRIEGMMSDILGLFERMLLQDSETFAHFKSIGANPKKMSVVGPLKSAARPLPADEEMLRELRARIGDRPVWLAAATHASEHDAVLKAAARVKDRLPTALLIVAPRHVADGGPLARMADERGLKTGRRSAGDSIETDTEVYVADTIGEMGLWYRLAPVSFIGHSLDEGGEGLDGKNPFEAAALGSVILHGPAVDHFAESYAALEAAGGAREIADAAGLADAVVGLQAAGARAGLLDGAERVIAAQTSVLDNSWELIRRNLPR